MTPRPTGSVPTTIRRAETLQIERGLPVPPPSILPRNVIKNTLLAMSPGDSFACRRQSVSTVYARAKECAVKVRIEKMPDGKTARVWRIA